MEFKDPFTMIISAPTGAGKTQWVLRLLQSQLIQPPVEKVYWYYSEWQSAYNSLKNVEFIDGVPDEPPPGPALIVINDQMAQVDKNVTSLFTRGSHHRNLSVILILQHFFLKGPETRVITLNSHYIVLMKNPRDKTIITSLARQLYPGNIIYVQESYEDATQQPY